MTASLVRYFHIQGKDLVRLKFILEAYEGLATLSTVDGRKGIISIAVPGGLEHELDGLLDSLFKETSLCRVDPPHFTLSIEKDCDCREHCHA